jgi:hypothetical protein
MLGGQVARGIKTRIKKRAPKRPFKQLLLLLEAVRHADFYSVIEGIALYAQVLAIGVDSKQLGALGQRMIQTYRPKRLVGFVTGFKIVSGILELDGIGAERMRQAQCVGAYSFAASAPAGAAAAEVIDNIIIITDVESRSFIDSTDLGVAEGVARTNLVAIDAITA